ncbi:MAG: chemotaxis protein CheA [Bacteroidota bacterium]
MDENFRHIYLEEATELLHSLENALLCLERDKADTKTIEEVFRIMHTFKGSSNMFGLEKIGLLTHHLETVYDRVRSGDQALDEDILSVTLHALDHLKEAIHDPHLSRPHLTATHEDLKQKVLNLVGNGNTESASTEKVENVNEIVSKFKSLKTYFIHFAPADKALTNGNNPLYVIDELHQLGKCRVVASNNTIPALDTFRPDVSYLSWDILLATDKMKEDIENEFLFFEGICDLQIEWLADSNLLIKKDINRFFKAHQDETRPVDFEQLKEVVSKLNPKLENAKVKETVTKGADETADTNNSTKTGTVSSIRVSSEKLDTLMNQISELITTQARLSMLVNGLEVAELGAITENMSKITRKLRDNAFSICLIPIDTLVIRFKRLVRDLSKELDKNIELVTEGTDTELDKSIIEKLSDPLLHLMRNCIDHGIEHKDVRRKYGKKEKGTIRIEAYNSGTNVIIRLSDDGAGIDLDKVRQRAIDKMIITKDAELTEQEIYQLLFKPGFSTAVELSDISGRGVGMDVVKRGIEDLQGDVFIESEKEKGTSFTIRLPLTLSIIDGLLVEIGENTYVIPLHLVDKCYEVPATLLTDVHQHLVLDGNRMPVFHLREALHCLKPSPKMNQIIKMKFMEEEVGISVDTIIGEHQVVLKPLGHMYRDQEEFSGATILGDGTVALVFDINKLLKKLINESSNNVSYGKLSYH